MRTTFEGPAILPGYPYRLRLDADTALFPDGAAFLAHVRSTPSSDVILTTLSTGNGGFVRLNDRGMDLVLTPEQSSALPLGRVVLDIVRSDLTPHQHLGVFLELPVMQPVTRGEAS